MNGSMGTLVAARAALWSALQMLSIEQMRTLHDSESRTLADLTRRWSSRKPLTVFQEDFLNEEKRLTFRLRQILEFMESNNGEFPTVSEELHLFCIKCNMPTPDFGFEITECPTCGSDKFLEPLF